MGGIVELAPWTTLSGSSSASITQAQREWVDVSDYADGAFWIDVKDITGSVRIYVDTAVTDEEEYFTPLFSYVTSTGTTLRLTRFADATTPMLRYVRWRLSSGVTWSVTFRITCVTKNQ